MLIVHAVHQGPATGSRWKSRKSIQKVPYAQDPRKVFPNAPRRHLAKGPPIPAASIRPSPLLSYHHPRPSNHVTKILTRIPIA